ncbi:CatB-related O-acetyltransferase [Pseudomonas flexibilis]|uniref:Acetyltransferase (Isoleucine patch superfamily) n=1 Tax=Pseudomonas flexibilis TaxID=706570 RepID=A0A1N6VZZ0_9PSED|nr:CatB-related O-acetyltransferase [Pseudomonas flexibilis]SIQ83441.1 Acetyltransferase (isoleucine patch superfamily) [Pseudomonas flexibilis]
MDVLSLVVSICSIALLLAYVMYASPEAKRRRIKKKLKKVPEFERGKLVFKNKYPKYDYGVGTYGLPKVSDFGEGTTLRIGSYCSIAAGVHIFLGGHHRTDWVSTYPFPAKLPEAAHIKDYGGSRGDVVIGHDVWLCSNCTILSGVNIGTGAVVAAEAVVTRNVEPYSIVAGNPAKVIGWRFDEETRKELLASEWWSWPYEEILRAVELLCDKDIGAFLKYARTLRK